MNAAIDTAMKAAGLAEKNCRIVLEKPVGRDLKSFLEIDDAVAHVRAFGARIPDARPSVLLDHDRRRPSEIDVINGAVAREAARCGRQAPVNATLTALVKQRERDF